MLYTIDDANALIAQGRPLHVAGDEAALARLRHGNWIGGTTPYFLTADGGCIDRKRVFVTLLPPDVSALDIGFVGPDRLNDIPAAAPEHGFSLIVIPAGSDIHAKYAVDAYDLPGIFESPTVGWVAGVHLDELSDRTPKVFNGRNGARTENQIVVMRAQVPASVTPRIGIINLFRQGESDCLRFPQTAFSADECWVNDTKASFFEYATSRRLDLRLPLIGNLSGEMINVSFQAIDEASRSVRFYAPLLAGVEYRQAVPLENYRGALLERITANPVTPAFSCNCILNYLYAGLDDQQSLSITGPVTFGEIAYGLLNQTLVYLELLQRRP